MPIFDNLLVPLVHSACMIMQRLTPLFTVYHFTTLKIIIEIFLSPSPILKYATIFRAHPSEGLY